MKISDLLINELNLIEDISLREYTRDCLDKSPLEFWKRSSSSTGKHHPSDERGEWGNLKHVKRALIIAEDLARAENLPQLDCDVLSSAIILHDIGKYGVDGKAESTLPEHPKLVRSMIQANHPHASRILRIIETHMGRWGESIPLTNLEIIGHYADYLASRSYMVGLKVT